MNGSNVGVAAPWSPVAGGSHESTGPRTPGPFEHWAYQIDSPFRPVAEVVELAELGVPYANAFESESLDLDEAFRDEGEEAFNQAAPSVSMLGENPMPPPAGQHALAASKSWPWVPKVDRLVRKTFRLTGTSLTGPPRRVWFFKDPASFARRLPDRDVEDILVSRFMLPLGDQPVPVQSVLRHHHADLVSTDDIPAPLLGVRQRRLRAFVVARMKAGFFETPGPFGQKYTPGELAAEMIGGLTTTPSPRASRRVLIQQPADVELLVHEALHFYVAATFVDAVRERARGKFFLGMALDQVLLEGFAERFGLIVMRANRKELGEIQDATAYGGYVAAIDRFVATIGEDSARAAYFGGSKAAINRLFEAIDLNAKHYPLLVPDFMLQRPSKEVGVEDLAYAEGAEEWTAEVVAETSLGPAVGLPTRTGRDRRPRRLATVQSPGETFEGADEAEDEMAFEAHEALDDEELDQEGLEEEALENEGRLAGTRDPIFEDEVLDGLDTEGLDTEGLDTEGLDTEGLDTEGLDTAGLEAEGGGAGWTAQLENVDESGKELEDLESGPWSTEAGYLEREAATHSAELAQLEEVAQLAEDLAGLDEQMIPADSSMLLEDALIEAELSLGDRIKAALKSRLWPLAVGLMVAAGVRDENRLTNLIFHAMHPELEGRSIRPGEKALAADWIRIRDGTIRPLLARLAASAAVAPDPVASAQPVVAATPQDRIRQERLKWEEETRAIAAETGLEPEFVEAFRVAYAKQNQPRFPGVIDPRGIPMFQVQAPLYAIASIFKDFLPGVGLIEAISGKDILSGRELATWERVLGGTLDLLPIALKGARPAAGAVRGAGTLAARTLAEMVGDATRLGAAAAQAGLGVRSTLRFMGRLAKLPQDQLRALLARISAARRSGQAVELTKVSDAAFLRNLDDAFSEFRGVTRQAPAPRVPTMRGFRFMTQLQEKVFGSLLGRPFRRAASAGGRAASGAEATAEAFRTRIAGHWDAVRGAGGETADAACRRVFQELRRVGPANPNIWVRKRLFDRWRPRAMNRIHGDQALREALEQEAGVVATKTGDTATFGVRTDTPTGTQIVTNLDVDHAIIPHRQAVADALRTGDWRHLRSTIDPNNLQFMLPRENRNFIETLRAAPVNQ